MAPNPIITHAHERPSAQAKLILRRMLQIFASVIVWGVILFGCAGTLDYPRGWIWLATYTCVIAVTATLVVKRNPAVAAARARTYADAKGFDKVFSLVYMGLLFAIAFLAPFDAVRWHWSSMPFDYVYPGIVLYVLGAIPGAWAMLVNPFLETQVRLQTERGHTVVTKGPYAVVRHPMYSGMLVSLPGIPLVLGSWWTFVIIGTVLVLLIWRTYMEDNTLQRELSGYEEYARKTRYRLVPGLW